MAVRTFRGTINADWNTAGNWLELAVPTVADDVFFDALSPACTLSAAGACLTLDCTGFLSTIAPGANALTVAGLLFKLVAGCWTAGSVDPGLDFTAVAGTVLITTAGNSIGSIRCGNAGAGGTYQLQDALALVRDLNLVRGTWQFNNQNAVIGRDLIIAATMAAAGCALGSGQIDVYRHLEHRVLNAISGGTATLRMMGTGSIKLYGLTGFTCYNLHVAVAGQVTTLEQNVASFSGVIVANVLTSGTGTFNTGGPQPAYLNPLTVYMVTGGAATPINLAAGVTFQHNLTLQYAAAGTVGTFDVALPTTLTGSFRITSSNSGNVLVRLLRASTVTVDLSAGDTSSSGSVYRILDLNGFNLAVGQDVNFGPTGQSGWCLEVGNKALTVGRDLNLNNNPNNPASLNVNAAGTVSVTRDVNVTSSGSYTSVLQLIAGSVLTVGRNWTSNVATGNVFKLPDAGTVAFTGVAPVILCRPDEIWPNVVFTIGGSCNLPAGFNCYTLTLNTGTLIALGAVTIRNTYNGGGGTTFNLGGFDLYIGSTFVGGGNIITAGSNIHAYGKLVSLTGFNPNNVTMERECSRLQLLTAMTLTGTLTIAPRRIPGVIQFLAGGSYLLAGLNSQVAWPCAPIQLISSLAGTRWNLTVTAVTSIKYLCPRDCNSATVFIGDLTNKDLYNNVNWFLNNGGLVRVITDDPANDELVSEYLGDAEYCWFVAPNLVTLTALLAAFLAGTADNWHRRTKLPWAVLDNLNIGTVYLVALGLRDERNRRVVPNLGAGDYIMATAENPSGDVSGRHIAAHFQSPSV